MRPAPYSGLLASCPPSLEPPPGFLGIVSWLLLLHSIPSVLPATSTTVSNLVSPLLSLSFPTSYLPTCPALTAPCPCPLLPWPLPLLCPLSRALRSHLPSRASCPPDRPFSFLIPLKTVGQRNCLHSQRLSYHLLG